MRSCRRKRIGTELFGEMLSMTGVDMTDLILIRPSDFMIAFLKKRGFLKAFKYKHFGSSRSKDKLKSKPRGPPKERMG